MKYSLLDLTQEIMASMDSDEVNSISDTTESTQVARIIRQAYFDLIDDLNPPEHYSIFELEASLDATKPTVMYTPIDINSVLWVKYDCKRFGDTNSDFREITFMPTHLFLDRMYRLNSEEDNVGTYTIGTVNNSAIEVKYVSDKAPNYYTVFGDDKTIIFDSYDSKVETTLQKSKTACYGKKAVVFLLEDSFIPDLDEPFFPRLLNEAKMLAFAELKSVNHEIANRNAKRSRNRSAARKYRVKIESDFDQLPYFGRK